VSGYAWNSAGRFIDEIYAIIISLILALSNLSSPTLSYNFTELFIYGGLAASCSYNDIFAVSVLLIIIAIYDAIAV